MASTISVDKLKATLKTPVGIGKAKAPFWIVLVAALGAYYVWSRRQASNVTGTAVPTDESATYGDDTYGTYGAAAPGYDVSGYAGDYGGGYSADGSSYDAGSTYPDSIPLSYAGGAIPVKVQVGRGGRRHGRGPTAKQLTKRIQHLKEGGVTNEERAKIRKLRQRRKALR